MLRLVARGLSNAEIGKELYVSDHTAKTHVGHVLSKLGLRDRIQAVIYAYESGFVSPGADGIDDARLVAAYTRRMAQPHPSPDLRRAEHHAVAGAVSVGLAVGLLALVGPAILIALSVLLIVVGIVLSLTVIGIVIGVPLIVVGVLGFAGGVIGGSLGPVFALLVGGAAGLLYYENRVRRR